MGHGIILCKFCRKEIGVVIIEGIENRIELKGKGKRKSYKLHTCDFSPYLKPEVK